MYYYKPVGIILRLFFIAYGIGNTKRCSVISRRPIASCINPLSRTVTVDIDRFMHERQLQIVA